MLVLRTVGSKTDDSPVFIGLKSHIIGGDRGVEYIHNENAIKENKALKGNRKC